MIDHIQFHVNDFEKSKAFYLKALEPLRYRVFKDMGCVTGLMAKGCGPDFWIVAPIPGHPPNQNPLHLAFHCKTRADVRAFHAAALAAGGVDNGAPGLRSIYHPMYYGAFVKDPDGNNIEACNHFDFFESLLVFLGLRPPPPDLSTKPKFL